MIPIPRLMEATQDHRETIVKGTVGAIASVAPAVAGWLFTIEMWLRIGSLLVGIAVGLFTIWSIVRKDKRDRKGR